MSNLIAILAIFMGLIAMGTTMAQMVVGTTAITAVKERPEFSSKILLPTMLVIGFLESILIYAIGMFLLVYLGSK